MRALFIAFCTMLAVSTAAMAKDRPPVEKVIGVGDLAYRLEMKEPLPNAFGKPDIFGRKRTSGYVEIRYVGQDDQGRAVFRRKNISMINNETTMSRSGLSSGRVTFDGTGATYLGSSAPGSMIATAGMDELAIVVNLAEDPVFLVEGKELTVLQASSSRATLRVPAN